MFESTGDNVIAIPQLKKGKEFDRKWGHQVSKLGFCMIPSILLRAQQRLGLNPTQLAILLHLIDFWWTSENKPFPSKETIAERLHISARQVQRHVADMEKAGLLRRVQRYLPNGGKTTNEYDLSGLVEKMKKIAPEIQEAKEKAKEIKQQATRRGGLKATVARQKKA